MILANSGRSSRYPHRHRARIDLTRHARSKLRGPSMGRVVQKCGEESCLSTKRPLRFELLKCQEEFQEVQWPPSHRRRNSRGWHTHCRRLLTSMETSSLSEHENLWCNIPKLLQCRRGHHVPRLKEDVAADVLRVLKTSPDRSWRANSTSGRRSGREHPQALGTLRFATGNSPRHL